MSWAVDEVDKTNKMGQPMIIMVINICVFIFKRAYIGIYLV